MIVLISLHCFYDKTIKNGKIIQKKWGKTISLEGISLIANIPKESGRMTIVHVDVSGIKYEIKTLLCNLQYKKKQHTHFRRHAILYFYRNDNSIYTSPL